MLAVVGHMVTTAGYRLPFDVIPGVPFSSIRNGITGFQDLPIEFVIPFVGFVGFLEIIFGARQDEIEDSLLDASGWDEETINYKVTVEINNGRAAQMGILALMVHEKLDNNPYIINSLLGYPVAFNTELPIP